MANGKLSAQLKSKVIPQRTGRTQRLIYQQQYASDQANFERLKAEAEARGETIGQDVIEHYQEQYLVSVRPREYSQREWDRMSARNREAILRQYGQGDNIDRYIAKGFLIPTYAMRDATRTRPYNLQDYESFYNTLGDDLKPFFNPTEQVKQQRAEGIETEKQKVISKQNTINQEMINAKSRYNQKVQETNDYYARKVEEYNRKGLKQKRDELREWQRKKLQDLEDEYNTKIAELQGFQTGLTTGLSELNQDKYFSYEDIENYAEDYAYSEGQHELSHIERSEWNRARQGYTPMMVTEFDQSGKPISQEVYFQGKKGDIKEGSGKMPVATKYNIKGLEEYGFSSPSLQEISLAGKKYKFKTSVPLFKEKSGDIVSPFGKTGFNENVLIKEAQDKAYADELVKQKPSDLKIDAEGDISLDYHPNSLQALYIVPAKKKVIETYQNYVSPVLSSIYNTIDKTYHWGGMGGIVGLSLGNKETEGDKIVKDLINAEGDLNKDWSEKLEKWHVGGQNIEAFNTDIEGRYSEINQEEFERKYLKDLVYETKSFEELSKDWESTPEYKQIQKNYQKEYQTGYNELIEKSPKWKRVLGAGGSIGLGLTDWGVKQFETPTKAGTTALSIYGGYKLFGKIPSSRLVLGTYGTAKTISPLSSDEERLAGLITAGVSFGSYGLQGYKKFKAPVTKSRYLYQKLAKLRASETIGNDITMINKEGKEINRVIFNAQKLSQQAYSGKLTMVSNAGREWFRKTWNRAGIGKRKSFREMAIYEGIPTRQLPKVYKVHGMIKGQDFKFTLGKSGYQKAIKSLTKFGGYKPAQARAKIRYTAPRILEQYLKRGDLAVVGEEAIGKFTYTTEQPKVKISKKLGINTRSGRTLQEVNRLVRKVGVIDDNQYVFELRSKVSAYLKRGKSPFKVKDFGFYKGLTQAKVSPLKKGYNILSTNKKINALLKSEYKQIYSVTGEQRFLPSENIININPSKTALFNKLLDMRTKGVRITGTRKTPFSKTFGSVESDKQVQKVADKIVQEQTKGDIKQQLKAVPSPSQTPQKAVKLKSILRGKQVGGFSEAGLMKIGQLTSLKALVGLKEESGLKSNLKIKNQFKELMKEDTILKSGQTPQLKTSPALKSQLRTQLALKSSLRSLLRTPVIKTTKYVIPKPPTPKPFIMPYLNLGGKKGKKKSLKKTINELAYLPDFTSRSLGLTETISQKQAQTKLKKLLTGFEIRKGVIIE